MDISCRMQILNMQKLVVHNETSPQPTNVLNVYKFKIICDLHNGHHTATMTYTNKSPLGPQTCLHVFYGMAT